MTPVNIVVIGSTGQVGWELLRALGPLGVVTGLDFPDVDLSQPDSLRACFERIRPRVVVNAAAYTAVDRAESEPERVFQINAVAPGIFAEEARRHQALLVHYSTDYVFDGCKEAAYVEEDVPNPLGIYGRSKLDGDRAVQEVGGLHLIFRLCWVYGGRGQNFLRTMLRLATTREELRVVNDQIGCPTWSRMIAEATVQAVAQVLRSREPEAFSGLYHLASTGRTTWHGFAEAIVDHLPESARRGRAVTPIATAEYPTPVPHPANSVLNCDRLEMVFGLRLPDWRVSLDQVFESPIEGFETLFRSA